MPAMPRALFRFRLRVLLIAVALIGVALGIYVFSLRANRFQDRCRSEASEERYWQKEVLFLERLASTYREEARQERDLAADDREILEDHDLRASVTNKFVAQANRDAEKARRLVVHHASLKRKYLRAASHPWESVPPDPPPPGPKYTVEPGPSLMPLP